MKLILERHAYAPELNTVHVLTNRGAFVGVRRVNGAQSIKDARTMLAPKRRSGIYASVTRAYPAPFEGLNRTESGFVEWRKDALLFAAEWRQKHQGGELLDGSFLPSPQISVKTCLIG